MSARDDEEAPVPRIGRGPLRPRFPLAQLVKIAMLVVTIYAIMALRKGCASGVTNWFNTVAPAVPADAGK